SKSSPSAAPTEPIETKRVIADQKPSICRSQSQ
ncbi:MAG: hypothetical protein ACI9UK_000504, partial [Candidatus Krumholzibacteriia bacterium]